VLAAVGSAVGLGNIWRFPFVAAESGGAEFLLVYILFICLVGLPAILTEFVVGRKTGRNPVSALQEIGSGLWRYLGWLFVLTTFVVMSYYSVVAGWTVRYALLGLEGQYAASMSGAEQQFLQVGQGIQTVGFHALFLVLVFGIVDLGVQRGIELAAKLMVPVIVLILIGLAGWATTLEGASEAYSFYLSPELGAVTAHWTSIVPSAAGQAFFTLSLGFGVMLVYSSYLGEDRNLVTDGSIILGLDTVVAVTVGLIIFPVLFTGGTPPGGQGVEVLFTSLSSAFGGLSAGGAIGAVFFATVAIAALSSAISLIEVIVSYLVDERGIPRRRATGAICGALFVFGIAPAVDTDLLELYDGFADGVLVVLGGLLFTAYVSWMWADEAAEELSHGITNSNSGRLSRCWIWLVRVPVVTVLVVSLVLGVAEVWGECPHI
jgi:Na+-dependent transporters of the SNF family